MPNHSPCHHLHHPPPRRLLSTQRSLAVDTETPAIPVPDHGADLEPQPHDAPPLPNEAAEHPIHQAPEQIRAPTEVGGLLESLPGEASQRAMGQMVLTSAHALEGKTPIGEAHGRPPDTPDPQRQGSTAWEPMFATPKARVRVHEARRPVLDEGARMRPDPWPNLGAVIIDPDTCIGSALQLEGEQNFHIPCVGSELHAAPSAPQHFSLSPLPPIPSPLDTLARENSPRGEGAATKRRTIEDRPRPELWKPPDPQAEDLQEAGGALSALGNVPVILEGPDPRGLAGAVVNVDLRKVEPSCVNAHERGGASPVVGAAPALAEGTAGVGPAGEAETATTAEPEALAPWAQDKAGRRHRVNVPPQEALPQKGERNAEALSRKRDRCPNKGEREPAKAPPPEGERERGTTQRRGPTDGQRRPEARPQGSPNEGEHEPNWAPREISREKVPSTWEGAALWDPGGRPPGDDIVELKGPVEAMDITPGIDAPQQNVAPGNRRPQENPGCAEVESSQSASTIPRSKPRTCTHPPSFHPAIREPTHFYLEAHREGHGVVPGDAEQRPSRDTTTRTRQTRPFGGRHTCVTRRHTCVTRRHTRPRAMHALVHWQRKLNARPQPLNIILARPQFLLGGISLQCPDCLQNEGECSKRRVERIDKIIYPAPYIP